MKFHQCRNRSGRLLPRNQTASHPYRSMSHSAIMPPILPPVPVGASSTPHTKQQGLHGFYRELGVETVGVSEASGEREGRSRNGVGRYSFDAWINADTTA